jgi:hypothetical protein
LVMPAGDGSAPKGARWADVSPRAKGLVVLTAAVVIAIVWFVIVPQLRYIYHAGERAGARAAQR